MEDSGLAEDFPAAQSLHSFSSPPLQMMALPPLALRREQ